MSWFLVRTKPRQERRAKLNLDQQGFTSYLPELNRDNGSIEALFPGYIFVENIPGPTPFDRVRSTFGVLNYVRFGERIALLDSELVESIRNRDVSLANKNIFEPSQKVRITSGAFKDIEAIYLCRKAKDRVILLLNFLGARQEIELSESIVKSA